MATCNEKFYDFNYNEITKINSLVDNKLDVQCINGFCDLILRKEYFHDTPEHLNNIGKKFGLKRLKVNFLFFNPQPIIEFQ